jgi:hypothetical protein
MASQDRGSWAKRGAYAAAWKYLIYVLIMKEISTRRIQLGMGAGGQIYRYIRDNHANQQASKLAALVSYLKHMEGVKIAIRGGARARELEGSTNRGDQPSACPEESLAASVIVLVDELDRGWDLGGRPGICSRAVQACISVNSLRNNLRVFMSLQRELYEDIRNCMKMRSTGT